MINIGNKICKDCNEEKPIESFNPKEKVNTKGEKYIYTDPRCKECRSIRNKKKYRKNPQKQIEATKKNYRNNREERIEYQKKRHKENRLEYLNYQTSMYWKQVETRRKDNRDYREQNKEYFNSKQKERTELYNLLRNDFWWNSLNEVFAEFGNKCSLTGNTEDITVDHFIPIAWGHGGTYRGNLIVLDVEVNKSKGQHNPFEWIKKDINRNKIILNKFNELVHKLADLNGLTVEEFEQYVYWCEENKRTAKQVKTDGEKSSLDLWKDSLVKI
ncbi:hypothetical protein [Metabacillus sp. Hm71]|uniref:hypothetical protein n=1 Tax=Metabacillus sp. Hm71 TaxID=3450743 RepID=UPI003F433D37